MLAGICEKLCKDFNTWHAGFPDLLLWRPAAAAATAAAAGGGGGGGSGSDWDSDWDSDSDADADLFKHPWKTAAQLQAEDAARRKSKTEG
eukprot:SAG22_NODE_1218_length_5138_cov_4.648938_5_plen_89_part_01